MEGRAVRKEWKEERKEGKEEMKGEGKAWEKKKREPKKWERKRTEEKERGTRCGDGERWEYAGRIIIWGREGQGRAKRGKDERGRRSERGGLEQDRMVIDG